MSAKEFWEDDPQLFVSYRISFLNKQERKSKEDDYKSWLQGLYIYDGNKKNTLRLMQLLHNMFGQEKNTSEIEDYPKKPYSLLQEENVENKKQENNYKEYHKNTIVQGSIKKIYLEKMKRQK